MTYRILSTLVQTFAGVTAHGRNVVISLNKRGTVDVSFDVIDIYIPREREKERVRFGLKVVVFAISIC